MVQEEFAATVDPQLLVCRKSPGLLPPPKMLLIVRAVFPPLVSTTGCGLLVVPWASDPKFSEVGETLTVDVPQPGTAKFEIRVFQIGLPVPIWLAEKYSFTYQNVQPFTGSTVILL